VETILAAVVGGLVIGALARLALPGPDPLPIWATILLGVAGATIGGTIGYGMGDPAIGFLLSVVAATLLLFLYRRIVLKRGITGPDARGPVAKPPEPGSEEAASRLRRLQELRDQGLISDEEFRVKREGLVDRV
jgi:uncharacterized membrane protein YeaQ/YmgE (transglycosylase-associated protein family)